MEVVLDGRTLRSEEDFHQALCEALEMGPYYGHNLDALWDRLSTDIERPVTLVWTHSAESRKLLGPVFDQIVDVLKAVQQQDAGRDWQDRFDYRLE
ncbi:MAG: barnase inhibitor [Polyangiaceae bacterium]|nr:barnase inhibitor [Polyangiaceae bacterium]